MNNAYVHGYDQRENIRLQDQALTKKQSEAHLTLAYANGGIG